jgi:hypothetical protein
MASPIRKLPAAAKDNGAARTMGHVERWDGRWCIVEGARAVGAACPRGLPCAPPAPVRRRIPGGTDGSGVFACRARRQSSSGVSPPEQRPSVNPATWSPIRATGRQK